MARTELPNGVILPAEYSDDWYEDMTSNLTKLDDVIGSDSEKLNADGVYFLRMSSAALTDSGTGNFSDLNSSYKIKTGDLVLDSGRKLYRIVSVDSTNETFTVGNSLFKVTAESDLAPVAESGDYDDLDNKPDLKPVATSGDYDDLTDLPTYGITRYCSSAITDNSTVAFSAISSTNKIKVGDFLLDTNGKLYQISSVDSVNETVSVTTPLTQLAVASDVVHKSGDETVGGNKTFTSALTASRNVANGEIILQNASYDPKTNGQGGVSTKSFSVNFVTALSDTFGAVSCYGVNDRTILRFTSRYFVDSQTVTEDSVEYNVYGDGSRSFKPRNNNNTMLGESTRKWKEVYANNYYYGSNNVEFSTKFVTTDTAQTISETKTFTNTIKSQKEIELTGNRLAYILPEFSASYSGLSLCTYSASGAVKIGSWKVDDNDNTKHVLDASLGFLNVTTGATNGVNIVYLTPRNASKAKLGDSVNKWHEINGIEPSSLSLPSDRSARVDISGYFTNMASGDTNTYTAPSNGWIYLALNDVTEVNLESQTSGGLTNYGDYRSRSSNGALLCLFPVRKDDVFVSQWYTTTTVTVTNAYFIPCLGNI